MSLKVSLHNELPHYSGNESVNGLVTLQCFKPLEVEPIILDQPRKAGCFLSQTMKRINASAEVTIDGCVNTTGGAMNV